MIQLSKRSTYFVWLPLATRSPSLFVNFIDVKASVLPTWTLLIERFLGFKLRSELTFVACYFLTIVSRSRERLHQRVRTAIILSPIVPPELIYVTD